MKNMLCLLLTLILTLCITLPALAQTTSTEPANTLVAYFSCTGNTEEVAQMIVSALEAKADVYEIVPQIPYADEDLNYNNDDCRANQEMNDPAARPEIAGEALENIDAYEVIYLGYPIWWGQAPRIISTFLESYDLSGKTIVPFCTSGSSGIEGSLNGLRELAPEATVLEGRRLNNATEETIATWLDSLAAK